MWIVNIHKTKQSCTLNKTQCDYEVETMGVWVSWQTADLALYTGGVKNVIVNYVLIITLRIGLV